MPKRAFWAMFLAVAMPLPPALALPPLGDWGARAASGTALYANDDGLVVVSPWLEASQKGPRNLKFAAGHRIDMVSAASVDVVTAASPPIAETRNETTAGVEWEGDGARARCGYGYSGENDTTAHLVSASGAYDLLEGNLVASLAYELGLERFGHSREPEALWRDRSDHRLDAALVQTLDANTLLSLGVFVQRSTGAQHSPYRMVPLLPQEPAQWSAALAQWVPERHPDLRWREGMALELRHAWSAAVFLRAGWRGYLDTWAVRSHAGELGVAWAPGPAWELALSERLYWQSRASFFRTVYSVDREFLTRDRRLSGQWGNSVQAASRWRWRATEWLLEATWQWTRYDGFLSRSGGSFAPMPDTVAFVGQAAVAVVW